MLDQLVDDEQDEADATASFYGSFHEVRRDERIVGTFRWEGMTDGVSLGTITSEPLEGDRTRVTATSVVDSFEAPDAMVARGMGTGVVEGCAALDDLLARG